MSGGKRKQDTTKEETSKKIKLESSENQSNPNALTSCETAYRNTSNDSTYCSICINTDDCNKFEFLECGHPFHTLCIARWLNMSRKNKCPVCRTRVSGGGIRTSSRTSSLYSIDRFNESDNARSSSSPDNIIRLFVYNRNVSVSTMYLNVETGSRNFITSTESANTSSNDISMSSDSSSESDISMHSISSFGSDISMTSNSSLESDISTSSDSSSESDISTSSDSSFQSDISMSSNSSFESDISSSSNWNTESD